MPTITQMPPLIVSDLTIAEAMLEHFPADNADPQGWQAQRMIAIAIAEAYVSNGANARACYLNVSENAGALNYTFDRGFGINEEAILEVMRKTDPAILMSFRIWWFYDVERICYMMMLTWKWRFQYATTTKKLPYSAALIYAYDGWTTYKNRHNPDSYVSKIWASCQARAKTAVDTIRNG